MTDYPTIDYLRSVFQLMAEHRISALKLGDISIAQNPPPPPVPKATANEALENELDPESWSKLSPDDQDRALAEVLRQGRRH